MIHNQKHINSQELDAQQTHANLDYDLLTLNKMNDYDFSRTIHLPRLVVICPVISVLER